MAAREIALTTASLGISKDVVDPVIRYLFEQGAIINEKDKYGLTPLHYACMRGNQSHYSIHSIHKIHTKAMPKRLKSLLICQALRLKLEMNNPSHLCIWHVPMAITYVQGR